MLSHANAVLKLVTAAPHDQPAQMQSCELHMPLCVANFDRYNGAVPAPACPGNMHAADEFIIC